MKFQVKWYQIFYLILFCLFYSAPFYSQGFFHGLTNSILTFIAASLLWVHAANHGYNYFLKEFKKELESTLEIQKETREIQRKAKSHFDESLGMLKRTRHE